MKTNNLQLITEADYTYLTRQIHKKSQNNQELEDFLHTFILTKKMQYFQKDGKFTLRHYLNMCIKSGKSTFFAKKQKEAHALQEYQSSLKANLGAMKTHHRPLEDEGQHTGQTSLQSPPTQTYAHLDDPDTTNTTPPPHMRKQIQHLKQRIFEGKISKSITDYLISLGIPKHQHPEILDNLKTLLQYKRNKRHG